MQTTVHTVTQTPVDYENPYYTLGPYLRAAQERLESTLLDYQHIFPDSLTWMGKFALSGPLRLFSLPVPVADIVTPDVAPWPLYVLLSCKAALGSENPEGWKQALPAAVAVEIAMAAADLLDELADNDPSPFVGQYGPGQALNTGNLMLVIAQQVLQRDASCEGGPKALRALSALQEMLTQAALGQHLDMLYERMGADEVTLEMSVQMMELKAGALMSGAYRIGAIMAGAEDRVVELLARIGKDQGCIAQLTNDVQDVIPVRGSCEDNDKNGYTTEMEALPERKTDLRLRKRTLPIVFTLREDLPYPNALQRAFASDSMDNIDEEELRCAILRAGGVQFANLVAEVHYQNSIETLNELEEICPGARKALGPLISEQ